MTSATLVAIFGLFYFGGLAAFLLIIPRLWRPEVPFGVSVPAEGTEEVRRRALRFWTGSVIGVTVAAIAGTLLFARFRPEMWAAKVLIIPYFLLGVFCYTRARKMLLPLALASKRVGAALRQRRYRDYMSPWWETIPVGLIAVAVVLLVWAFLTLPRAGGWRLTEPRRIVALVGTVFPAFFVYPLLLLIAVLMAHSKQSVGAGDPEVALAANEAFRTVWIRYMYAIRVMLGALFATVSFCVALANRGFRPPVHVLPFVLLGCIASGVAVGFIIALRYGQGGWRWAVRQGLVEKSQVAAILNGDGMPDARWKFGMFYFNPSDPSVLVEKRFGVGWTVNLGSIWGIALVFAFVGMYLLPSLLRLFAR
ncbi:MAG: hypothetical protein AMK75_04685 [Planctomycetes bacterium SM23_65]|nr:MAG: hypothetical protein AMK75_04685 [Planctomycetes bacterium SM23_65]